MTSYLGAPLLAAPADDALRVENRLTQTLGLRQGRLVTATLNAAILAAEGRPVRATLAGADVDAPLTVTEGSGEPFAVVVQANADADTAPAGALARLRARVERGAPEFADRVYTSLRSRDDARLHAEPLARASGDQVRARMGSVPDASPDAPAAVLIGMHWLDVGGAERWALHTVQQVRDAGLVPVVVTDRRSAHPLLTDPLFADTPVVALDQLPDSEATGDAVLRSMVQRFALRGVLVHHSRWLYDRLAWLAAERPDVAVIDALHIIEYGGGGFPRFAVEQDAFLTTHHVISPVLQDWLTRVQGVDPARVTMAPLLKLGGTGLADAVCAPREEGQPLTLAFVGRLVRQKRPYLFLRLVASLRDAGVPVRAILHGDGDLDAHTASLIARWGLGDVVEQRAHTDPVADTIAQSHVLVVSSANEGLTLTTMEAIAAGVPVVSADVGSQRTLVSPDALVSANPAAFVREATAVLSALAASDERRCQVWEDERRLVAAFAAHEDAESWIGKVINGWAA